jgi:DNA-binding transcriptional ArsR family regulator
MSQKGESAPRGEMRRRHEAIIRSGVLARLGSEGRLVLTLGLCWADYKTCQFRMSARGAASVAGVQQTTVRRGIRQLIEAGVIEVGPREEGNRQRYRFKVPQIDAHVACEGGAQGVRPPAHGSCAPPHTPCAHTAHTTCAVCAHHVRTPRTGCAPYSSIVLKGSSRTREGSGRPGPGGPDVQQPEDRRAGA